MKSVLISIQPKWVEKIVNGKKTIEVRKSRPKIETPFKCYIYATKSRDRIVLKDDRVFEISKALTGKVIGEFICDKSYLIENQGNRFFVAGELERVTNEIARQSCLYYDDMVGYLGDKDGYGWHISDLKIYDKPKELNEFQKPCKMNLPMCDRCEYYSIGRGRCENITRPPQSWQYVED